ncbi:MAG TPA: MoaD/ThiS family protein [Gemmatimonadales bacterium]|jgi:molybdopterin converting factor small subunit
MATAAASDVRVRVLLFASYAESLGFDSINMSLASPATVGAVVERLRALPGGDRLPPRPLCALNLAHVGPEAPVAAGDEIAVLPPLAGG